MNSFEPGMKCLIDGKTEAIIVKSLNRTHTKYVVEIANVSVQMVERERLQPLPELIAS
jgi:hypothetical protein